MDTDELSIEGMLKNPPTCDYCGNNSVKIQCDTCGGTTPSHAEYYTTRVHDTTMSLAEFYEANKP